MRIAAVVLVMLTLSCPLSATAAEGVEINVIAPLSNIFAPAGKDMAEGVTMAFDPATCEADEFLETPAAHRNYPPAKPSGWRKIRG